MDIIFAIAEISTRNVHIYFRRPRETEIAEEKPDSIFVSFYSPRTEAPEAVLKNHFWLSRQRRWGLFDMIYGLLETIEYEHDPEKEIFIHFGWPLSSWMDRISTGVMIFRLIHLPRKFPKLHFNIDYKAKKEEQNKS